MPRTKIKTSQWELARNSYRRLPEGNDLEFNTLSLYGMCTKPHKSYVLDVAVRILRQCHFDAKDGVIWSDVLELVGDKVQGQDATFLPGKTATWWNKASVAPNSEWLQDSTLTLA